MKYRKRRDRGAQRPGLGVRLDREKLREYSELYQRLGGYPYDRDPGTPRLDPHAPERSLGRSARRSKRSHSVLSTA